MNPVPSKRRLLQATALAATTGLARAADAPPPSAMSLRMATSWPTSLPLLHDSAVDFARTVAELTDGRLTIQVVDPSQHGKPAGILDLVRSGEFDLGHTTAQYYAAAVPAIDFFTAVPFGLTPLENHAWMQEGRGLALFNDILSPLGVQALVAGDTGIQMGGWFNREITKPEDLRDLRIRIAGFPGRVLTRLGARTVGLPLGQVADAFKNRQIDAADIVGPMIDQAMGVAPHAPFYYAPWHEMNVALHLFMNRARIERLPSAWQAVLRHAAQACALRSLARAQQGNALALQSLQAGGVQLRRFPESVMAALKAATQAELDAASRADARSAQVIARWHEQIALSRTYAAVVDQPALSAR